MMTKRMLGIALSALVLVAQPVSGQILWEAGQPGDDIGSVAVMFGVLAPSTSFSDDGSSFEQGTALGLALNYWPFERLGLRTHVLRAKTPGDHGDLAPCPPTPCSAIGYQEPVVWDYALEAAVRLPMGGGGLNWFPYLSAGVAGKSYRWSVDVPRVGYTGGGFTAAGGVEVRTASMGPFGFIAEARTYQTKFQTLGKNERQSDFALTAGITLSR